MRKFRVENNNNFQILTITLHEPPYEDENILNKTGWKSDHVTITEITPKFEGEE